MTFHYLSVCMAAATCIVSACTVATPIDSRSPETSLDARSNAGSGHDSGYAVEVTTTSLPQEPAYGWHYYSDPPAEHAVVISPVGEYFLSLGRGMEQVTGPDASTLSPR